jgi:hypothetical protein
MLGPQESRSRMHRILPTLLLVLLPAAALGARWGEPEVAGLVTHRALDEISGLAASRKHPGHYWAINDSGRGAELQLMDDKGQHRASVPVAGVPNIDWEDLASFEFEGRRYLLVADTGDNGGIRSDLVLHVIEEPGDLTRPAAIAWSLPFRWPDGPRDCEAVAVDPRRGEVLLISKKRVPPELFRIPLRPAGDQAVAEYIGDLAGIEQPDASDLRRSPIYGRYRAQVTGADLSPNGRVLAVLNYRSVHFIVRPRDGDWARALGSKPSHLILPWMPQAEAIAFAADGQSLVIGSEQLPSPLLRYRVEP